MKEKLSVLLGVLLAAYVLYGMFAPPAFDASPRRPLSTESGPSGYQGLWRWLSAERIGTHSFRDRYTALTDPKSPLAGSGNVMIVSIPQLSLPDRDELNALLDWIHKGNTVLVAATLNDTLAWSYTGNLADHLDVFEYLTDIEVEARRLDEEGIWPRDYVSVPVAGHWLTEGVRELAARSEAATDAWDLVVNPDQPAYVLATTPATTTDALLVASIGAGALVISTYGSLLQNSVIGQRDNRRFVANLLRHHLAPDGLVLFDDGHQGLHSAYDARAFARDPRLWGSMGLLLAFWILYAVFADSRLGPAVEPRPRASQADFVRMLGGFLARKVSRQDAGLRLIENFLAQVAPQLVGVTGEDAWQRVGAARRMDRALAESLRRDHERLRSGRAVKLDDLQRRLRAARRAFS